jgi:hypothetical protein
VVPLLVPLHTALPCSSWHAGTGTSVPLTPAPALCPARAAARFLVVLLVGCMALATAASHLAAEVVEEVTAPRAAASAHNKYRLPSWQRTLSAGTELRVTPKSTVRVCKCTIPRRYRIRGVRLPSHALAVRCDYYRVTLPFTVFVF